MNSDRLRRGRAMLLDLTRMLAGESRGGILEEAVAGLRVAIGADAAAAYTVTAGAVELVAHAGLMTSSTRPDPRQEPPAWLDAIERSVGLAVETRAPFAWPPPPGAGGPLAPIGSGLGSRGWKALLAVPALHAREVVAALVVVAHAPSQIDEQVAELVEIVALVLTLALERDRRAERDSEQRQQLLEAARMASLGLLIATVGHELRGPVSGLTLLVDEQERLSDIVKRAAVGGDPALGPVADEMQQLGEDMNVAVRKMRHVLQQLASASRRDAKVDRVDLSEVAREALALLRPELARRRIALVEHYESSCGLIGRADSIGQVVMNLVFNAADACEASGKEPRQVIVGTSTTRGNVVLSVEDTGPGVPAALAERIFQPFYTTKTRGTGTGLGLAVCADVAAAHHGHIEVRSRPEGGACFRVVLPVGGTVEAVPQATTAPPEALEPGPREAARKVLVVDDDDVFARTLRRALRPHEVCIASSVSDAIAAIDRDGFEPDVVLCDVTLPDATGDVLHVRVRQRWPHLADRFVFVTGGGFATEVAEYLRTCGRPTLLKPVDLGDLLAVLAADNPAEAAASFVTTLSSRPPPDEVETPPAPDAAGGKE